MKNILTYIKRTTKPKTLKKLVSLLRNVFSAKINSKYRKTIFSSENTKILSRETYKSEFCRCFPQFREEVNNISKTRENHTTGKYSFVQFENSFILVRFEVTQNKDAQFVGDFQFRLVNIGPIAPFSEAKHTTSSSDHLIKIEKDLTSSLIYKPLSSFADASEIRYEFDSNLRFRENKLTIDKNKVR